MGGADYAFTTVWHLRAARKVTWDYLVAPEQRWTDWWPRLRSVNLDRTDALLGSTASCRWRSPWGYVVGVRLRVVGLEPGRRVELEAWGDLAGRGVVLFDDRPGGVGTRVTTHWEVTTTPRWMRVLAPVLRPVFAVGHHAVMRGGERGLDRALGHHGGRAPAAG